MAMVKVNPTVQRPYNPMCLKGVYSLEELFRSCASDPKRPKALAPGIARFTECVIMLSVVCVSDHIDQTGLSFDLSMRRWVKRTSMSCQRPTVQGRKVSSLCGVLQAEGRRGGVCFWLNRCLI